MKYQNIYIVADVEGIAGLVFYEHLHPGMSMLNYELLHRNRVLLTEEVNAAARGAFAAGARTVVVHDHHGAGYTILPELMDERIELVHGRGKHALQMGLHHPDLDDNMDALLLIGMHAKAGTIHGCTPHSLLYTQTDAGDIYQLSEATMSMAIAGDLGIPCLFIAGDQATVNDALELVPEMGRVITKKHIAPQMARTISPILSRKRIEQEVKTALENPDIRPFVINGPCTVRVADRNPAALWPQKPEKRNTFSEALTDTLLRAPWNTAIERIDDGWRYPDKQQPAPDSEWNVVPSANTAANSEGPE